jgi:formamidopyrimidine-DNA glycosylase
MPELPEVETIRRGLEKYILGYKITHVDIRLPKIVQGNIENIVGAAIVSIERFGKGLVVNFDDHYSLAIHVKMTGQLIVKEHVYPPVNIHIHHDKTQDLPNKWTHVIFSLESKKGEKVTLYYNDIRQFGWIKVVKTQEIPDTAFFKQLGKEPLKDLTIDEFSFLLKNRQTPIKQLLMDQTRVAGVGNIYANDALWEAKIDPRRKSRTLTQQETNLLFSAIENVLIEGIERGGASETNYVNARGGKGSYQEVFRVYKKDGKVCPRCGKTIVKIRLGGRGTWYCPGCQV